MNRTVIPLSPSGYWFMSWTMFAIDYTNYIHTPKGTRFSDTYGCVDWYGSPEWAISMECAHHKRSICRVPDWYPLRSMYPHNIMAAMLHFGYSSTRGTRRVIGQNSGKIRYRMFVGRRLQ